MPVVPDPDLPARTSPQVPALLRRVLDLVAAARRAGIGASQSEAIDATRVVGELDLLDRAQLREGLASVIVTAQHHRAAFDLLFDLYLPARPVDAEPTDGSGARPDDASDADVGHDELVETIGRGDENAIRQAARRAVEAFGRVDDHDGGASYFRYRVLRAVDLRQLLEDLLARAQDTSDGADPGPESQLLRDEVEARLRIFEQEIDTEIRRRAAARRGLEQVADRLVRPPVEGLDLLHLTADEQARVRAHLQPLARKLATRLAAKHGHGRPGRLDVRRTVRRSLSSGGIPFEPAFLPRRPHKPELFVLCDVSGSVASFARFTLMLVHALQERFTRVRSFVFIDTIDEVTTLFDQGDPDEAVRRMIAEADVVRRDGHSDYGQALGRFHARYADEVTPRATVLILGDARNNHRQPSRWVLEDLQRRARRVYWLNPEPRPHWDTGDSIAAGYARHVDEMVEVRNLEQLAAFVEHIA